ETEEAEESLEHIGRKLGDGNGPARRRKFPGIIAIDGAGASRERFRDLGTRISASDFASGKSGFPEFSLYRIQIFATREGDVEPMDGSVDAVSGFDAVDRGAAEKDNFGEPEADVG